MSTFGTVVTVAQTVTSAAFWSEVQTVCSSSIVVFSRPVATTHPWKQRRDGAGPPLLGLHLAFFASSTVICYRGLVPLYSCERSDDYSAIGVRMT